MRAFVSSDQVAHRLPASLVAALRAEGWEVHHSVVDTRQDVYAPEITAAIMAADVVIAVVVGGFDSTWQAIEADVAARAGVPLFCWNPEDGSIALGARRYARRLLPRDLAAATAALRALRDAAPDP